MDAILILQMNSSELETLIDNSIRKVLLELPNSSKVDDSKLMRLKEAAIYLGLAETTLYALVHQGKLKPLKPGKHLLFPKSQLQAYQNGELIPVQKAEDPSTYLRRNKKRS